MVGGKTTSVSFDNSIKRERARQKRQREGGQHQLLSEKLEEHKFDQTFDPVELAVPLKKIKKEPERTTLEVLQDEYDEVIQDITNLYQTPKCPFHDTELKHGKGAATGFAYYRCVVPRCVFFCGEDQVHDWVYGLTMALHSDFKEKPTEDLQIQHPFTCLCTYEPYHDLKLCRSTTKKHPNRFFLTCKFRQCKLFQWLDTPMLARTKQAWKA